MLQARGLSYQRAGQQILAGVDVDVAALRELAANALAATDELDIV